MTSSEAVAVEVTARDRESLRALYHDRYDALAAYAYRVTGDAAAAEDLVQEAFTRLLARRLVVASPVAFLYRVIGNLAVDAWRRRQRDDRARGELRGTGEVAPYDPAVRDAVRRLPRDERTAVLLYYFADLPVGDVARLMRKPAGTVTWLLSAARAHLADQLGSPHA